MYENSNFVIIIKDAIILVNEIYQITKENILPFSKDIYQKSCFNVKKCLNGNVYTFDKSNWKNSGMN